MLNAVKKIFAFIVSLFTLLFLTPLTANAAPLIDCDKIQVPFKALCVTNTGDVSGIIGAAISFIFVIGVIIAIFFMLLGAVKWIYSGGDKAAVEAARGTITAAVIGLVVLFLVFLLFTVVLGFFGVGFDTINDIPAITPSA